MRGEKGEKKCKENKYLGKKTKMAKEGDCSYVDNICITNTIKQSVFKSRMHRKHNGDSLTPLTMISKHRILF